jgi:hypothetical protein
MKDGTMAKKNHTATAGDWKVAGRAAREGLAEPLRLPSGVTILAVKPAPLEWIMSGRIPQRLLAAALQGDGVLSPEARAEISREEILELARFATHLVKASVVRPPIGEGPDEISLDDIPVEDRGYILAWACRALSQPAAEPQRAGSGVPRPVPSSTQEDLSSDKLERFRAK